MSRSESERRHIGVSTIHVRFYGCTQGCHGLACQSAAQRIDYKASLRAYGSIHFCWLAAALSRYGLDWKCAAASIYWGAEHPDVATCFSPETISVVAGDLSLQSGDQWR